jgi:hypothetical protein
MRRFILGFILGTLLICGVSYAYRIAKPIPIQEVNLTTLVELNRVLEELWDLTNGRMDEVFKLNIGDVNDGNYMEIQNDGDVVFYGTSGLAFGEIYTSDNSTETTIATQNVWVQCTTFNTNGLSNNSTPDHTNDHITITKAGKYMISVSASVVSGAGSAFDGEFEVKKNNGTVDLANIHTDRDLTGGGGDHGSISMTGIADLSVDDTIEIWTRNKTNTTNLTFEDITLTIVQIGG